MRVRILPALNLYLDIVIEQCEPKEKLQNRVRLLTHLKIQVYLEKVSIHHYVSWQQKDGLQITRINTEHKYLSTVTFTKVNRWSIWLFSSKFVGFEVTLCGLLEINQQYNSFDKI